MAIFIKNSFIFMGYGLKRLLEIEAERKARKEEKERIKKEKEAEKKRLKKIEHKKKLKKKQNRRAYLKRRNKELEMHKELGDEKGYYSVYITKNLKKVRTLGKTCWKVSAYKIFNDAIKGNREKTFFPETVGITHSKGDYKEIPIKYEILIVKKTDGTESTVASFRNEDGKFVEAVVKDWEDHVIIEKADWFVEEKFVIYGHHPRKGKTYSFILNEMLLNNDDCGDNMRRVMVYGNKLIIQYLDDFDFIKCYDNSQCERLYDKLQEDVMKEKKKYIVFMGKIVPELVTKWMDKFEEKTGWKRNAIKHNVTK